MDALSADWILYLGLLVLVAALASPWGWGADAQADADEDGGRSDPPLPPMH